MEAKSETPKKRPNKPFRGVIDGKSFTTENQPSPESKSKGWQERRSERLLTQMILEKIATGNNLKEYVDSLFMNAKGGNPKAIDTINYGIEDDIKKFEISGKEGEPLTAPQILILSPKENFPIRESE